MSVFDKLVSAVTPPESEEARTEARRNARALAKPGDWLSLILDDHEKVEQAFENLRAAEGPARLQACKQLATLLNGHSMAEEAAVYPVLAQCGEKAHAGMGYTEQAAVKMQLGELENIDPSSQAFMDKVEHIRGAVLHHVYEEEHSWYPDLMQKASPEQQQRLRERYAEEIGRYLGGEGGRGGGSSASISSQSGDFGPTSGLERSPADEPRTFGSPT